MRRPNLKLSPKRRNGGYSLIELAISLVVVGSLAAGAIGAYTNYKVYEERETTEESTADISTLLGEFRAVYGRYPCPAPMDAAPGDADYGRESADCVAGTYGTPGTCINGICTATSANVAAMPVLVGTLPFKILAIRETDSLDGYSNRITYAITAPLTSTSTFNMQGGGISIVDDNNNSIITPPHTAHFVTVSHGRNSSGARGMDGSEVTSCVTGGTLEQKNCDNDSTFYYGTESAGSDDLINYYTPAELSYWQQTTPTSYNIHLRGAEEVAVGALLTENLNPTEEEVKVRENTAGSAVIHAKDSKILTNNICEYNPVTLSVDCFLPNLIGGDPTSVPPTGGMKCPASEPYMVGIKENAPICKDELWLRCPAGQYIVGISGNKLICKPKTGLPCLAKTVTTTCGTTYNIDGATHGTSLPAYSGMCYRLKSTGSIFTNPNKSSPEWAAWIALGPKTGSEISDHIDYLNDKTRDSTSCRDVSPTSSTAALVRDTFKCVDGNWSGILASHEKRYWQSPFVGDLYSTNPTYKSETSISYDNDFDRTHTNENHDCWCREDLRVVTQTCGTGYTFGSERRLIQKFQCAATSLGHSNSWLTVHDDRSACVCDPLATYDVVQSCVSYYGAPAGSLDGNVTKRYGSKCVLGVNVPDYTNLIDTIKACSCPNKGQVVTVLENCPLGTTNSFLVSGEATPRTGVKKVRIDKWICPGVDGSGNVLPGYWDTPTQEIGPACTCNAALTKTEVKACPAGETGSGLTYKVEWNCLAGAWEPEADWEQIADDCRTCSFKSAATPHIEDYAYGKKINEQCACGTSNAGSLCWDYGPAGKYYRYTACNCTTD